MSRAAEAAPPLAVFDRIGKTFGDERAGAKADRAGVTALANLDLTVNEGEFLSLLGPSGCGKSTALRLIAGLAEPTTGAVRWRDGRRPETGFVFQDPTLMPWSNVADNVWLPLRLRGVSRRNAAREIDAALDLVGLSRFARAYPRELSGGMRMRVSIARALTTRPSLLLLDEPFAALDEITRFRLNDDLLRLREELSATVIFVTHSVFESVYLSGRIAVFSAHPGRVTEVLDIAEPYPRDRSWRATARFAEACRDASAALERAAAGETQV